MYCDENAPVIELVPNTRAQNVELSMRTVVLSGTKHPMLDALHILQQKAAVATGQVAKEGGVSLLYRQLHAPYGRYRALSDSDENIVAVHVKADGQIDVYGPFEFDEEAYDYFPSDSSPHDSWVAVFGILVQKP